MTFLCPHCRTALERTGTKLACPSCLRAYPLSDGIADFAEGAYFDVFDESVTLPPEHLAGLAQETAGASSRIHDFYLPLIAQRIGEKSREAIRILDSGCGNGLSVDILADAGFDAWGHDLSALRKWQWRERARKDRLFVADALRLPVPDASFDFVLSSGVIEHLGVRETGGERYTVEVLPSRDALRREYLRELLRVATPGGTVFVDCPNGAFPIDFWHGTKAGAMRWHSPFEGFLSTFAQIATLTREIEAGATVRAISPLGRLRFEQVGRHWYGRAFALPMRLLLASMKAIPALAHSPVNPYLVVAIEKSPGV